MGTHADIRYSRSVRTQCEVSYPRYDGASWQHDDLYLDFDSYLGLVQWYCISPRLLEGSWMSQPRMCHRVWESTLCSRSFRYLCSQWIWSVSVSCRRENERLLPQ